jgi:hypothetical protein
MSLLDRLKAAEARRINKPESVKEKPAAIKILFQPSPKISSATNSATSSCKGCAGTFWKKVYYFLEAPVSFASFVAEIAVGLRASEETQAQRKTICESCLATDSSGARLYREAFPGQHSCGKPWNDQVVRDPSVDGCGCFLEMKWIGKNERCPLPEPKWDKEIKL